MNIPEISQDEQALAAKAKAALAIAKADEAAVKSWFAANWHYAVAISVGALILGVAFGYNVGLHSHV